MKKKGQMKISFGMIVSIILIIIFLSFAIYIIMKLLNWQDTIKIKQFENNFQSDIDKMWKAQQGATQVSYRLPSKIKQLCIMDYEDSGHGKYKNQYLDLKEVYSTGKNVFFYPPAPSINAEAVQILHINLEKTTAHNNPMCFENEKGKVKMVLKKEFGEALVTISN